MNLDGLLRALLYQVVAQRPDILPSTAPKDWESLCLFGYCDEKRSEQSLRDMFFRAVKALSRDSKLCLFIDGLDEFTHSHKDLITMIKNVIKDTDSIKVCAASRPWNIFQTTLGHEPNSRLEDLTSHDIKNFVQSRFGEDTEFEKLRQRYPLYTEELMDNIVGKASGVFLWVDLVVTSFLTGMRLGDKIQDFQRRLDDLPADLETYMRRSCIA